jgi:transposase InsO family protein
MKSSILRQLVILPLLTACMACCTPVAASSGVPLRRLRRSRAVVLTRAPASRSAAWPSPNAASNGAQLKLERVNDSRCRKGMVCVWAGYISYSFVLTGTDGSTSQFVLSDNMPNARPSITEQGWTITLTGLEPQAAPAKDEITPNYRVSLG